MRVLSILFLFACAGLHAQSPWQLGFLPEVTVSHKLSDGWKVTGQIESMQQGWRGTFGEEGEADYHYIRTDLTTVASYKWHPLWSLAGGFLYRFTEGVTVQRFLQQVAAVQRFERLRLGHRLRTDQTFRNEAPEYRLRYRLSAEWPLQGSRVDAKEWYLISSVEQVGSWQAQSFDWEQRLVSSLGYYFDDSHKLEVGFDYRWDQFLNEAGRHRWWWTLSYFVNI